MTKFHRKNAIKINVIRVTPKFLINIEVLESGEYSKNSVSGGLK